MNRIKLSSSDFKGAIYALVGTLMLVLCAFLSPVNHYISALLLIICSISLYFLFVFIDGEKNVLSLRAVFTLVWLFTIGLANLRLAEYQEPWQQNTWFLLALAYAMFQIGMMIGSIFGGRISNKISSNHGLKKGRFEFKLHQERLFWICIIVTLIGLLCFIANVAAKGFIPYFVKNTDSYLQFYTKFYLFAVAASMISGLCYYCFKTQKLSKWKKTALILCIIYSTFVFPILVVSRGNFICSALSLTAAIFYLNKKRFLVLVSCVIVMLGIYEVGSSARKYTNATMNELFQPSEIIINPGSNGSNSSSEGNPSNEVTFQLPAKVAFFYSYLTVSHDNFNEAVQNATYYTYGIRQLKPFNVLLRIPKINDVVENSEYYLVRPYLNTVNLVGYSYYDFRWFGVGFLMLIWAIGFGAIESCYLKGKGIFALLALGVTLTPVALCFFDPWMSEFSLWMNWGLTLILAMIACITIIPRSKQKPKESKT